MKRRGGRRGLSLAVVLAVSLACGDSKSAPTSPGLEPPAQTAVQDFTGTAGPGAATATSRAGFAPSTERPTGTLTGTGVAGFAPRPTTPRPSTAVRRQADTCVDSLLTSLSLQQRVGQLFMVGLSSAGPLTSVVDAIQSDFVGNIVLFGTGWNGDTKVKAATTALQGFARQNGTGIGLFISGNQEGGATGSFQAFYGQGFSDIPAAIRQAQQFDAGALETQARLWGRELSQVGVNLDLAPVMDVVPAANVATNQPIGVYGREYGSDPQTVGPLGAAFVRGMRTAGVATAIKHFPGLGRVTGNTDFTAEGIVDNTTTAADLQAFKQGIDAGAPFVMVSLATYTRLDRGGPAVFSPAIIGETLRGALGFQGIILTDDVGAAAAVASYFPEQRAVNFFVAGGDMVLTIQPTDIPRMISATLALMSHDEGFSHGIDDSVRRVLMAKHAFGLLTCTGAENVP